VARRPRPWRASWLDMPEVALGLWGWLAWNGLGPHCPDPPSQNSMVASGSCLLRVVLSPS